MKNKKLWVSLIAGLLVAALVLSLFVGLLPREASAQSSSQLKEHLDSLKSDRENLLAQMKELEEKQAATNTKLGLLLHKKDTIDQKIQLYYENIDNINDQIAAYNLLIADKQEELDAAQERLETLRKQNLDRIRIMEEEGELTYWSVLFGSHSFADFLDRMNMVREIAAADKRRLDEMVEITKQVEAARDQLAADKAGLEQMRTELELEMVKLEQESAEQDRLVEELRKLADEQEGLYEEFEKEEDRVMDEIAGAQKEYDDKLAEEESIANSIQESIRESVMESIKESIRESIAESIEESVKESIAESIKESIEESIQESIEESRKEEASKPSENPSGVHWIVPVDYIRMTSPFGYRWHPVTGEWTMHRGVDLSAPKNTPIYASRSGVVTKATWGDTQGNYVTINHQDGYSSVYMHMTRYVVKKGEYVEAGQLIGYVGSTGRSTGNHLHFGISLWGQYVDPMEYIG